jgi:hypothetical protein
MASVHPRHLGPYGKAGTRLFTRPGIAQYQNGVEETLISNFHSSVVVLQIIEGFIKLSLVRIVHNMLA